MWALMTSPFGIYFIVDDLDAQLRGEIEALDPDVAQQKAARNQKVVDALTAAVTTVVCGMFGEAAIKDRTPVDVSIVMDEFGSSPGFVRGLCAAQSDARTSLAKLFPFEARLKLIVVGTGTDVNKTSPGSLPASYATLRMPAAPPMLEALTASLNRFYSPAGAELLVKALNDHCQARYLIQNPRFAALLFKRITEYHKREGFDKTHYTYQSALLSLDAHLVQAARDYRNLNSMSDKGAAEVESIYALALALLFRDPGDITPLTIQQHALIARQGVLTDCAVWQPLAAALPSNYVCVLEGKSEDAAPMRLVAPKRGRFEMSMAQQLLFRMSYGFGVLEAAASLQRYEVVIAEYVSALLAAHKDRKLGELMQRLGLPTKSTYENSALQRRMEYDSVALVHNASWISPKIEGVAGKKDRNPTPYKSIRCLHDHYTSKRSALVIVNGAGAPYADVIVVVPRVAVILIQCKFYGDSTQLTNLPEEAASLKVESAALNKVAKLPDALNATAHAAYYFRVLATNKALNRADLGDFCCLNTSDATALAPLVTPIRMPAAPVGTAYTEVRVLRELAAR
jgi:hypothetical protein